MLTEKISRWLLRATPKDARSCQINQSVALGSSIGHIRKQNQDRLAVITVDPNSLKTPKFVAVALADGMGGMSDGAECAALAIGSFFNALIRNRHLDPEARLEISTEIANKTIFESYKGSGGATLSAVLFTDSKRAYLSNVGDSRIYATQTKPTGGVDRLTVDDSLAELVGGHGRELLQFMGMGEGLTPHIASIPYNTEKLILTSDGAHFLSYEILKDIMLNGETPSDIVEQLLTYAHWRGAPDNASAACISMDDLVVAFKTIEPEIEISDSFGSLQLMWLKHEHKDFPPTPSDLNENQSKSASEPEHLPSKVTSTTKKPRRQRKNMDVKQTQFEISIEPNNDAPNNKGIKNDFS